MDLETEMQVLLSEENYLGNLIEQLSELENRNGYDKYTRDIIKLIKDLKDKKETIQENIQDLTDQIIMSAEVWAGDHVSNSEANELTIWDY